MEDARSGEFLLHLSQGVNLPINLISGTWALQLVFDTSQEKVHIAYKLNVPTAVNEQLYFNAVDLISRENRTEKKNIVRNGVNRTLAGEPVWLVQKSRYMLTVSCSVGLMQILIQL